MASSTPWTGGGLDAVLVGDGVEVAGGADELDDGTLVEVALAEFVPVDVVLVEFVPVVVALAEFALVDVALDDDVVGSAEAVPDVAATRTVLTATALAEKRISNRAAVMGVFDIGKRLRST